ncbi:TonB-dependent receptor [Methylomonas sp. AM2-LC]|uniref:TonB-dependent siderophore receptor n=1 Tax=Methylomonas sp. AM2-LC TaxID=3153301 RepID=UPI0032670DF5
MNVGLKPLQQTNLRKIRLSKQRRMLCTVLGIGLIALIDTAFADETTRPYHIPAQALDTSLLRLAADTGLEILFTADQIRGMTGNSLDGNLTTKQALDQLLKGSGYTYRFIDEHTVTLEKASTPPASQINQADPTTLPKVTVVGNAVYDATNPYNEDYVLPNATSGTKTDTLIMETPLNVQVISKQVLKDQQVISLDQALRNVSGVVMESRDNPNGGFGLGTNLYLRGFQTSTFFRNGFRIDNPSVSTMGLSDRQFANVESVEVLKGSSAILYGRVEPGGMVNVITKQPLATPYYSLTQQFGSYNTNRTSLDSSGPLTQDDTLLYRLNMSYQNQGSFRDGVNSENFFIAPIIKWNINPRTQASLEMEYQHDTEVQNVGLVPGLNGQLANIPYNRNYFDPNGINVQDTYFIGLNWSHQFNDDWSIKHRIQVNKNNLNLFNTQQAAFGVNDDSNGKPILTLNTMAGSYATDTYSTGLDLTGHFNTGILKHTLLFGGDYYRYTMNQAFMNNGSVSVSLLNPAYPGMLPTAPDPTQNYTANNQIDNYGFYLQDQIQLPYHIHLLGGMRYQYIHEIFNIEQGGITSALNPINTADAVTPRAGVLWNPESWLSVYANYTEGFGVNTGVAYPSGKPVPPTGAKQYEGGIKTEFFDGRLRATLAYYDLTKTNIPTPVLGNLNTNMVSVTGEANSHGPEFDIMGEILPGWNVIANYTNMAVHITKSNNGDVGNRFYNVPRNMSKIWSTYEIQQGDLQGVKLGGGVTMQDDLLGGFAGSAQPISGYATVSLMSGYSFKVNKAKITAQLNVENLLDKHYYTGGVNYLGPNGIPQSASGYNYTFMSFGMPRTLMGSINIQY